MSKIKNIILEILTLVIVVSVIPETHVFSLQDSSVENNAFMYQSNYQNQNQPIKQLSASSRATLLQKDEETVLYEELAEYGYLEEKDKRTEDSKTFIQGEEKKTYIFSEPIHYIKNGEFIDYDNTLQKSKTRNVNEYYQTVSNDHAIMLPSNFNSAIKVDALSFTIDEVVRSGEVKQDSIIYQGDTKEKDYRIQATSQGVKVTSAISNETIALTQRYTVTLPSGYTMKTSEDKKAALIYQGENIYATFSSVDIKDADGNIVEDGADIAVQSLPNSTYIVTVTPTPEALGILRSLPYENITSVTRTTNRDHNIIKAYGVRSGSSFAHRSYAPEVNSSYSHFALTGRDPSGSINEGVASPENVALVQVDFNTIKNNYIGSDRCIDDASIHFRVITSVGNTSNLSISRLSENMSLFGNYGGMTWNNYNYYFQRYQNRNESYSPVRQDFKQVTKIPGQELWVGFDISEAISYWNDGNPAYGFIIEGDSADTTAQALANHSNINGADRLPYMVITHTPNGPVNKNEPLANTTLNVRPFTQSNRDGMLHFTALGFDGISRPNSEIQIQVVDTSNNNIVYDTKSKVNSDWRIFPAYDPITNCQRYYRKTSNYQFDTLLLSKNLKVDCLYQIRYKVTAYDKDGKITETQEFKNSDTFQIYKVKAYDRLARIIEFYGITNQSQFRLDNNIYDSLLFQGNQIIIRNPTKNKNQAYSKTEYSMDDKKAIDAALMGRGFHCEFGYEPINFNTGNLYYSNEDSTFIEYGQTYTIARSYNSLSNRTGLFGKQWDFNWDFQLALLDNAVMFSDGTGKQITFFKDSSGKYSAFNHVNMTLTKQKIGEKEIVVDSGYYDQDQTPIQTVEKIPIYQFVLKDNDLGRTYLFDEELFIKEVILDVYNHKVTYSYDSNRNVTKMTFSSGKEFTFTYNALHFLTKITYPNGTTTKYEYDNEGHLLTFIDQLGNPLEYKYNSNGLLDSYLSRENKKVLVKNVYDSQGRVIKQTNGANETVLLEYKNDRTIVTDYNGNKKTIYLDENKRTKKIVDTKDTILKTYDSKNHLINEQSSNDESANTQYVYNDKNQITNQIRYDGKKKQYFYNTAGNVIKIIDFNGEVTTFSYNTYGNMTHCVYPDGSTEIMQYNGDGQQTYNKDVYGRQTYSMYQAGNKIKETNNDGYSKIYTYNNLGKLTSLQDEEGNKTVYIYNDRGERISTKTPTATTYTTFNKDGYLVSETDGNGYTTHFSYDSKGNMISKKDALGTYQYEYDKDNHLIKSIDPLLHEESYTYDKAGNKTSYTNALNDTESYIYQDGKLIETINFKNTSTKYTYDVIGQLIKEQKGDKYITYQYDSNGQLESMDVNGQAIEYKYDQYGNIIYKKDGVNIEEYTYFHERKLSSTINGKKTTYVYDVYGNLIEEVKPDGNKITYTYTPAHYRKTSHQGDGIELQYQYDGSGHLVKTIDQFGYEQKTEYDANGNIVKEIDANGNSKKYGYIARNLKSFEKDENGFVYTYEYDGNGNLIKTTDPYKRETTYRYDNKNRLILFIDSLSRTQKIEYDANDNITNQIDAKNRSEIYEYDMYNRVSKHIDVYGKETTYQYDLQDHIVEQVDSYGSKEYKEYDTNGLLISSENEKGLVQTYQYDAYGKVVDEMDIYGNHTKYTYDILDRVQEKITDKGLITSYTYDVFDHVIEENTNGNIEYKEYDSLGRLCKEIDALGNETKYQSDNIGNIIKVIDSNQNETEYRYDSKNQLIEIVDAKGNSYKKEYDAFGNVVKEINPDGTYKEYIYDCANRLLKQKDELGYEEQFSYDQTDLLISSIDKRNNETTKQYDELDLLTNIIYPDGSTTAYSYTDKREIQTIMDGNHNITEYVYDEFGRNEKLIKDNGLVIEYEYDEYDNVIQAKDSISLLYTSSYNSFGELETYTTAKGNTTTYSYDVYGRMIETVDHQGNKESLEYDATGRVIKSIDKKGIETTNEYDALGNIIETKSGTKKTSYTFDSIGLMTSETDSLENTYHYKYDTMNRVVKMIDPMLQETTVEYNATSNIIKMSDGLENTISYGYDENGNCTSYIDRKGYQTVYYYDVLNRQQEMLDPNNNLLSYKYDDNNNPIAITYNEKKKYAFTYNSDNQVLSQKDAKDQEEIYKYDKRGNQTSYTNKNGVAITYRYDNEDNLISKASNKQKATYKYDINNQLVEAANENGISYFTYNQYGEMIRHKDSNLHQIDYQYDEYGRKSKILYDSGKEVSYTYDTNDNILSVSDNMHTTIYGYDALNRQIEVHTDKTSSYYTYDLYNQVSSYLCNDTNGNQISLYNYQYDANGNMILEESWFKEDKVTKEYTYDTLGQLTSSKYKVGGHEREQLYTYDDFGNRVAYKETWNGKTRSTISRYNNNDELIRDSDTSYSYDKQGNVVRKVHQDGKIEEFTYNDFNQLTNITDNQGKSVTYTYDALDNRIGKQEIRELDARNFVDYVKTEKNLPDIQDLATNDEERKELLKDKIDEYKEQIDTVKAVCGSTKKKHDVISLDIQYVNDITKENTEVLEIYNNTDTESYVYGNNRIQVDADNQTEYYIYDGRGSVVSKYGEDNTSSVYFIYEDFGNTLNHVDNSYTYNGEQSENGVQYLRARYYDSNMGRFLQRDNYLGNNEESLSHNQYIYTQNNPYKYTDPSGHFSILEQMANVIEKVQQIANTVVKEAHKQVEKATQKIVEKVVDVASQQSSFIDMAKSKGLEQAAKAFAGIDGSLLDQFIKAYCEELGLDYASISAAIKNIIEADAKSIRSLSGKYTLICETIKYNDGESGYSDVKARSVCGYHSSLAIEKTYLSSAIKLLIGVRVEAMNLRYSEANVRQQASSLGNKDNSSLSIEYYSDMISHANDMNAYITSGKGKYKLSAKWVSDGNPNGTGTWQAVYVYKGSSMDKILSSKLYEYTVATGIVVQVFAPAIIIYTTAAAIDIQKNAGDYFQKNNQDSNDNNYKPPEGGGGTTSTITVNEKTITIGHGGRHLEGTNLTVNEVNTAISNDVVNKTLSTGFNEFTINIKGTNIVYRAFQLGPDKINIGTYFIPK